VRLSDSRTRNCPAAGLGTAITFNVAYDEAVRASCVEVMRQGAQPYHGGQASRTGAVARVRPFSRLLFAVGCRAVPHTQEITLSRMVTGPMAFSAIGKVSRVWAGNSAFYPCVWKPCSSRLVARRLRSTFVRSPSTTAISLRPSRVALATTLKPLSQMNPVFMPSAPA
jgi:hypothetical protein